MTDPQRDVMRAVLRAVQSPMNAERWCLDLACGHEIWVSAKRQPRAKRVCCPVCSTKEETP
jgi:hypothetical protein